MKASELPDLLICVKNESGKVLEQTQPCIQLCGNMQDQVCQKDCIRLLNSESDTEKLKSGFHFFEKRKIGNDNYDVVILKKPGFVISALHPTKEEISDLPSLMEQAGLTKREKEVLQLRMSEGLTLKELCDRLYISRATIRTHMNNINRKIAKISPDKASKF